MNEEQFDQEFDVEKINNIIVDKITEHSILFLNS
jgi:hypothetical protein